jgi:hypothetical protein
LCHGSLYPRPIFVFWNPGKQRRTFAGRQYIADPGKSQCGVVRNGERGKIIERADGGRQQQPILEGCTLCSRQDK